MTLSKKSLGIIGFILSMLSAVLSHYIDTGDPVLPTVSTRARLVDVEEVPIVRH